MEEESSPRVRNNLHGMANKRRNRSHSVHSLVLRILPAVTLPWRRSGPSDVIGVLRASLIQCKKQFPWRKHWQHENAAPASTRWCYGYLWQWPCREEDFFQLDGGVLRVSLLPRKKQSPWYDHIHRKPQLQRPLAGASDTVNMVLP